MVITNGFTYLAVLMFIAGGLLALQKYAKWKVFNVVPPLVWIYICASVFRTDGEAECGVYRGTSACHFH